MTNPSLIPERAALYLTLSILRWPFYAALLGYYWTCIQALKDNDNQNIAPPWKDVWPSYWKNGLKVLLFALGINGPMWFLGFYLHHLDRGLDSLITTLFSIFISCPLIITALVQASDTQQLAALFEFKNILGTLHSCYGKVIQTQISLLFLGSLLVSVFMMITYIPLVGHILANPITLSILLMYLVLPIIFLFTKAYMPSL